MRPLYDYGDEVRVLRNVRNDGTFPGQPTGALLVRRGSTGYVRDLGTFLQDQIIYSVHILDGDRIVGCREEELQPASEPWTPSRFESREKVAARIALGRGGRVLVEQGLIGEVIKVLRGPAAPKQTGEHTGEQTGEQTGETAYHVLFPGCSLLQVPESALEPAPVSTQESALGPASAPEPASAPAPAPEPASASAPASAPEPAPAPAPEPASASASAATSPAATTPSVSNNRNNHPPASAEQNP